MRPEQDHDHPMFPGRPLHRPFLSNQALELAMAMDWSITHSPTPRYLSTHFLISLFSEPNLSVLTLYLTGPQSG
jgi:hypothetical protein